MPPSLDLASRASLPAGTADLSQTIVATDTTTDSQCVSDTTAFDAVQTDKLTHDCKLKFMHPDLFETRRLSQGRVVAGPLRAA